MTINKLKSMPYAQAKVKAFDDGTYVLTSYATDVAIIDGDWLTIYGLYSMTTRKHIGAFVKEYANVSYQLAKSIYEHGERYNIITGEVEDL